jgi:hypothetical protein
MLRRSVATTATLGVVAFGAIAPSAPAQQVCSKRHGKRVCQKAKVAPPAPLRASGYVKGVGIVVADVGTPTSSVQGATVGMGKAGGPSGVYCLTLVAGGPASRSVVVASPAGPPPPPSTEGAPYVAWIPGAPDCTGNAVEVRTWTEGISGGQISVTPSDLVSFSFLVR